MSQPNPINIPRSGCGTHHHGGTQSHASTAPTRGGADMPDSQYKPGYQKSQDYLRGDYHSHTATQGEVYRHYENNLQQQGRQFGGSQAYSSGAGPYYVPALHSHSQVQRAGGPQHTAEHRGGGTGHVTSSFVPHNTSQNQRAYMEANGTSQRPQLHEAYLNQPSYQQNLTSYAHQEPPPNTVVNVQEGAVQNQHSRQHTGERAAHQGAENRESAGGAYGERSEYEGDDTPRQRKKSHRIDQPVIEDEDTVKSKNNTTADGHGGTSSRDRTSQTPQLMNQEEHHEIQQEQPVSPPIQSSPVPRRSRRPKNVTAPIAVVIPENHLIGREVLEKPANERQIILKDRSYYGELTGKEAMKILRGSKKPHCYLTRWSEKQRCYILTVYYKRRPRDVEKHFKIQVDPRHKIEGKDKDFDNIRQLLEYYEENCIDPALQNIGVEYTKAEYDQRSICNIL